jgi:hypothetical protein
LLKGRALGREWEVEGFELSRKVGAKLANGFIEGRCVLFPIRIRRSSAAILRKHKLAKSAIVADEQ